MTNQSVIEILVTNGDISNITDKIPLASGVKDNINMLTSETFWVDMLHKLQENQWIFAIVLGICVMYLLSILMRIKKQKKTESNIMNMFNKDGSRNEHLDRREYHISTPVFVTLFVMFIWYVVASVSL